jgi:tRNA-specific 2-thiouridylase
MVKVRSLAPLVAAHWSGHDLVFDAPMFGVAPGQAAVAYREGRVLGGATIAATVAADAAARLPEPVSIS